MLDGELVLELVFLCSVLRGLKIVVPSHHKALFMRPLLMSKFKISSNHRQKVWNTTLISNVFDYNTTQLILNTPLHPLVYEDKFIWKAEKNGSYSVRSAYQICVTEIADNSHLHIPGKWSSIWKLKVPPKIRNFVWRVSRLFPYTCKPE